METRKTVLFLIAFLCIVAILLSVNIFFVVDVYSKRDYIYTSNALGTSMYPYICNGDTIVVLTTDSPDFSLGVGDVLVFVRSDDIAVAHRIYNVDNNRYFVKGDNNVVPDSGFVYSSQVIGKVYGVISRDNVLQKMVVEQFINN